MLAALLCSTLAISPAPFAPSPPPAPSVRDELRAEVTLDAARKLVVVTAGPFKVAGMPPGMKHEDMEMMDDHNTPVYRFEWPVEGWLRGFEVELVDAENRPIDRGLVHHLIVINFDRRQLLYSSFERVFGIGKETRDVALPKSVGVPFTPGTRLGLYLAWDNQTGKDLDGVKLRLKLRYSPKNLNPRPLDVLPFYSDVNLRVGSGNGFTIPTGRSEKAWEFTPVVGGRLLGVSGHLHDYGVSVRLEEAETGRKLTEIVASRDSAGKLKRVGRKLLAVRGKGLRLKAGVRYRVVGVYDNPTGEPIKGMMASMVGLYVPESLAKWPALDLSDPTLQDDLAFLTEMGGTGHKH